ncbi:MAG TPA: GNAT family N-acetyltransferase [Candidatus Limnocylindrales bacterium]|nr:GNAT family N-acetyltransferase [Candidatus Limnocylindrales bacterium]
MAGVEAAGKAVTVETLRLQNCCELEEFRACVALQQEVWGFSDAELAPLRIFSLAPKIGGQVVGAWEGNSLVGFAMAIPGSRNGRPYLHSHMVAVKEGHRNTGLGRKIKLFQREDAIAHGYELMEWTFDPLEIKNAYFNLERLGAIARRYNVNQYGITNSPLQGFLPTDRLVAEWWMTSRRVQTVLSSGHHSPIEEEERIEVPGEIYAWKAEPAMRSRAEQIQSRNREHFQSAFSRGLACLGYERDADGNGCFQLGRWDEDWSYAANS